VSKPIWIRLRRVLERDADASSVELSRENAEEMLAEIKRLAAEVEWHKKNSAKWQDTQAAHLREVTRLTAEVAEYEAMFDAQWNADMRGVQMWREAHPGNDMVLPDRANFTSWILAEIVVQRAENEKLKAGLRECEAELNAHYRMKYPGSHPHSQKELAQAMTSNPATVALKEVSND
jgi:hypothetical protein